MRKPDPETTRAETITAALLYLMTHYARTGCARLHGAWSEACADNGSHGNALH